MSLINLLEGCKDVAMAAREEMAARAAEDVAEFEEFGADLAAALDEEENLAAEEALRLGQELDDREDDEVSEREKADLEMARQMLAAEEDAVAACEKDELIAQQMDAALKAEAVRVAKLEQRERKLQQKLLSKSDFNAAARLAQEIELEEARLRELEAKDRRLANQLVKEEGKVLASLPQTEEKLRELSESINGKGAPPMRARLVAKLSSMRKGMADITNKAAAATN